MTANPEYEFSFRVDVHSLPDVGRHYAIEADAAARARVATRLELPEISSLKATFDLTPGAGDIINVAGHRLSTGSMEEVLASHRDVAECAVVGVKDELKGQAPIGLVVLKAGVNRAEPEIAAELVERVRSTIGAFACFKTALVVAGLPKTRSGKILRGTMKKIADGDDYTMPATIEDASVLQDVAERLHAWERNGSQDSR